MKFTAPAEFTKCFPEYVYRSGKGSETVQWREAALDMANDRAKLIEELRTLAAKYESLWAEHCEKVGYASHFMPIPVCEARALLRELEAE
jgi:hypothetical protein